MTERSDLGRRIRHYAETTPEATAFVFHRRHDDEGERLSFGDLWHAALPIAQALPPRADDRTVGVVIFCDDARAFVVSLLATWMAGAVAVPATGGLNTHLSDRNRHIFEKARPDIVLHDVPEAKVGPLRELAPAAAFVCVNDIPARTDTAGGDVTPIARLLNFTSGSTRDPKPVLLAPETLDLGCAAIVDTNGLTAGSVGVNWLPLYHDMGLVGSVLVPLWVGCVSVILRPSVFIQRPLAWMLMASAWRASITTAPNFAYERLCAAAENTPLDGLDLSAMTSVIFGGEQVMQATVDRFLRIFGPRGLNASAIAPSYGMAEVALLASSGRTPSGPRFDTTRKAVPVACLGPVIPSLAATIRDQEGALVQGDGEAGQIWLDGPGVGQLLAEGDDWRDPPPRRAFATGDLGYLADGRLYVTGRTSNRILVRGRNVYAEDIEAIAMESQPTGRLTGAAAFGVAEGGTETVCLLLELVRSGEAIDLESLHHHLIAKLGVKPGVVVMLRRNTLPRTSSGKVRRALARADYLAGRFAKKVVENG